MSKQTPSRQLFHTMRGGFDLSRLVEQMIPTVLMGIVVIYANSLVTAVQINTLKEQVTHSDDARVSLQANLQQTNVELAKLNAQVVAFLGQQVTMNAGMDARLTYLERSRENGVTVIQPQMGATTTIQPRRSR